MKPFGENCRRLTRSPGITPQTQPGEDDIKLEKIFYLILSGKSEPPPLSEQELVIPSWRTGEVSASYRPSHRRNASLPPRPQDKKQVHRLHCLVQTRCILIDCQGTRNSSYPTSYFRRPPLCRATVTCPEPRGQLSGITISQTAK